MARRSVYSSKEPRGHDDMGAALVGNLAKVVRSMIGLRPARADVVDRLGNRRVATGRTGVAKHYFRYSLANALVVMAGLVSFPVLTRFLDNAQYGILGYYDTLVLVAVAVIKLGSQHAMLRFYPANGGGAVVDRFATSIFMAPVLVSLALWMVTTVVIAFTDVGDIRSDSNAFWWAFFLVPFAMFSSVMQVVLMASERSATLMFVKALGRWVEVGFVTGGVVLIQNNAATVFGGKLAVTALLCVYYVHWIKRNFHFSMSSLDINATLGAFRYGIPMMANELAWVALVAIDRVMLKEITSDFAAVGIYAIGYSLAMQINVLMSATLSEAFVPVANRIHGAQGDEAVRELKRTLLRPLTYACIGVAAMVLGVGNEVIVALSGPAKAASGDVFVIVGMAIAIYPMFEVGNYGLLLRNKSTIVLAITLSAAALNILLNLLLIPRLGFIGAAWSTVASYAALAIGGALFCPRGLFQAPGPRSVLLACSCAAILLLWIEYGLAPEIENIWIFLFMSALSFAIFYAAPVWAFDRELRAAVMALRKGRGA